MRRSRLSAALTLCGLLAFATSATADCAWVLWSSRWDGAAQDYQYRYVDSFTAKPACDAEAASRNRNVKETQKQNPGVTGLGFVLQCAPDTIDPRGPKGR
jgi:hypothetical protein